MFSSTKEPTHSSKEITVMVEGHDGVRELSQPLLDQASDDVDGVGLEAHTGGVWRNREYHHHRSECKDFKYNMRISRANSLFEDLPASIF